MAIFLDLPKVPLPGPRALPVVGGRLSVMRFLADPVSAMLELHSRYGDLVALARDDPGWICVFNAELNRRVLSDPGLFPNFIETLVKTPEGSAASTMDINILAQNGEDHRRTRRTLMAGFTKPRLRGYAEQMVAIATEQIDSWPRSGSVGAREQMSELSLRIAMRCLFGLPIEDARALSKDAVHLMSLVLNPATMLRIDRPWTPYGDFLRTSERIDAAFRTLFAKRRREGFGDDVLSALLSLGGEEGEGFSDRELVGQSATLFNASHETTAMTLTWACLMLAAHPEVQEAAAREVEEALGDRPPTLEDLDRMPRIGWIVDEVLRLFPATPNLFFRRASADFELGGRSLPAGATILVSPLISHRDPGLFPRPRRFDPWRWEELKVGPYEYIPFGAGARRCLGAGFSGQASRLILAVLLQRVRLSLPRPQRIDYVAKGVVLGVKQEIPLAVHPAGAKVPPPAPITGSLDRLVEVGGRG